VEMMALRRKRPRRTRERHATGGTKGERSREVGGGEGQREVGGERTGGRRRLAERELALHPLEVGRDGAAERVPSVQAAAASQYALSTTSTTCVRRSERDERRRCDGGREAGRGRARTTPATTRAPPAQTGCCPNARSCARRCEGARSKALEGVTASHVSMPVKMGEGGRTGSSAASGARVRREAFRRGDCCAFACAERGASNVTATSELVPSVPGGVPTQGRTHVPDDEGCQFAHLSGDSAVKAVL
jgi:hypothetical protein